MAPFPPARSLCGRTAGAVRRGAVAPGRDATAEEREQLWPKFLDQFPGFDDYQRFTARKIPVVLLEPVAAERDSLSQ